MPRPQIAAYYFPDYHPSDGRNIKEFGKPWDEWELVKAATPRFPGHDQPRMPAWGYTDESDPAQMARKIAAAADHGINAFIFDWYHYNDGPFLERGLEQGFLRARNNARMKFALMWANHDWEFIFPAPPLKPGEKYRQMYPGQITPETWRRMTDYILETYFKHPTYWMVEGKPYFSIYDLGKFVASFGSVAATRDAMDGFRDKAVRAGFAGINMNAIVWGRPVLPAEDSNINPEELADALGFDSISTYVWLHHVGLPQFPANDFLEWQRGYFAHWDQAAKRAAQSNIPYYPNVSVGWDSSPRTTQTLPWAAGHYPYTPIITGNTPERFEGALAAAKTRLLELPASRQILTINSWNEWTEGSYLEPDVKYGMGYLEAIRNVFGALP